MEPRLSLVTLGVRDIARARKFYEQGLGWTRAGGEADVAFYQTGATIISLYEWDKLAEDAGVPAQGSGFRGISVAFCTRDKQEVNTVIEEARKAGARIVVEPREAFWGGYNGYFEDLDGHLWEVAWNPMLTITEDGKHLFPPAK